MESNWQRDLKEWGFRFGVITAAVLWLMLVASSWAESADAAETKDSDEYNFTWLDPDKKIYVLQNRKFLKANHLQLSVLAGPGLSNPYRSSMVLEPRFAYYFREDFGIEAFFGNVFNSANTTYQQLQSTNPVTFPVVREINSEYGALLHWVPWYSKINVFNKILYFDWYFSGGAGQMHTTVTIPGATAGTTTTSVQDLFSLYVGTGHQYHLSQSMLFRLDFQGAFYRAPFNGLAGDSNWFSDYRFAIGLGWQI